ncbi:RNA-directed DNA polymerase, eukaryota, partial [Tanacetum coccineum]
MEGFDSFVENTWKSFNIGEANGLIRFNKKLQFLKIAIKAWTKEAKMKSNEKKLNIQQNLLELDKIIDQGRSNEEILCKRIMLINDLHEINSKNARVVWDCGTNKSPGPDGFSFEFSHKYWSFIDQDIFMAVKDFFMNGCFPRGCNSSFIALIPKIQDAKFVKDFRPIRLGLGGKWDYLDETLKAFGFGQKWCLKQGDPLSYFLFILIMETLHLSFMRILNAGLYKGISLNDSFMISHLFYADDIVFVGEWNDKNIYTLLNVLKCFYLASGLKINLHKSKLMGIGVNTSVVETAANLIGCSILSSPFNYLGVKVGSNISRISSWDDVVSKVSSRLSIWKLRNLSIGGRLTLLKPVLTSIPLYHMSIYKVPMGVLKKLESIRRNFFNGTHGSVRKSTWINWSTALTPKKNGGLGVSSFFAHNRALLF